jgi:hypothetical protein
VFQRTVCPKPLSAFSTPAHFLKTWITYWIRLFSIEIEIFRLQFSSLFQMIWWSCIFLIQSSWAWGPHFLGGMGSDVVTWSDRFDRRISGFPDLCLHPYISNRLSWISRCACNFHLKLILKYYWTHFVHWSLCSAVEVGWWKSTAWLWKQMQKLNR